MLMNDFYTVSGIQQEANALSCSVVFNAAHAIFNGHFPGHPVVPGVCMLEIIKELLQQQTGTKMTLRQAGNVKFLQLITPEVQPVFHITWKSAENGYSVVATISNKNTALFKMNGEYSVQ
jgi:3-hydroxyacyl-[acyl-carrier-protein] dehydratase